MSPRPVAVVLVAALATSAGAYDSQCTRPDGSACEAGPDAAQNRWLHPSAEHRIIWERTRALAGLPAAVSAAVLLDVFTGSGTVLTAAGALPTLVPAPFAAATRVRRRELTIGELAQLPDFSYSLWDWALGNETCPLADGSDPIACHEFATHMGAVNSNHFLPQARAFYAHYHGLALDRAAACRGLAAAVGGQAARFRPILEACEDEALVLEAVGHHYLQDAWSTGHMWERWGSPDPAAFPDHVAALGVAMASGLIHGARGVLQAYVGKAFFDVPDALCAPAPGVRWRAPGMPLSVPGLGDLYYPRLTDPADMFGAQAARLFSCTAAGMRAVYDATGGQHGPMAPLDPSLWPVDPLSDDCFAQRATNQAMLTGAALDVVEPDGTPLRIPLDGDLVTLAVISAAEGGLPSEARQEQYRLDMANALFRIAVGAAVDPDGVQAASGALPPLLGVRPNAVYVTDPPAPYAEPPLPWRGLDSRRAALVRTFHRAHADDLCRAMSRVDEEPMSLEGLRDRAQAALPPDDHATALAACTELAARHLRFGTDETDYDTAHEALCAFVPGTLEFAYTGGAGDVGPDDLAATRNAAADWCLATTTTTTTSTTTTTVPLGEQIQFRSGSTGIGVKASGQMPNVPNPPPPQVGGDGSQTFPWSGSASISYVIHATPPNSAVAAADATGSAASSVIFDAAGNLVGITGSGTAGGQASLSGTPTWQGYPAGARADGSTTFGVRFRVSGAPVGYIFDATVTNTSGSLSASAGLSVGSEYIVRTYAGDEHGGSLIASGMLPPREEEYMFSASAFGAAAVYSAEDVVTEFEGEYQATLTLVPAGDQ